MRALILTGVIALAISTALVPVTASAGPGDLDHSFGNQGWAQPAFPTDWAGDMTVDPSGRVLVAGRVPGMNMYVGRLLANGSIDTRFGGGDGTVSADVSSFQEWPTGIDVDPWGRIVVSVATISPVEGYIVRFTPAGAIDTSFGGGDGIVGTTAARFDDILSLTDGSILAVGSEAAPTPEGGDMVVRKLLPDGSPDASFGSAGWLSYDIGDADRGMAIAPGPTNGFLLAGSTTSGGVSDFAVVKVDAAGTATWSKSIDFGTPSDVAMDVTLNGDRAQVVGGSWPQAPDAQMFVSQLTSSGDLDTGFDGEGKIAFDIPGAQDRAMAVLPADPSSVTVGSTLVGGAFGGSFTILRIDKEGQLDPGFSGDGMAQMAPWAGVGALATLTDSRIVGMAYPSGSIQLARFKNLLPDSLPDIFISKETTTLPPTGQDVYGATRDPAQTLTMKARVGKRVAWGIGFQNDGMLDGDFWVKSCAPKRGFPVTYWVNHVNVTPSYVNGLGYGLWANWPPIGFTGAVIPKESAAGRTLVCAATLTDGAQTDLVTAIVKVR